MIKNYLSDFKKELEFNLTKQIKVNKKQYLTRIIKIKIGTKLSEHLKKRYNINNRYQFSKKFTKDFLENLSMSCYFHINNYSKIKINETQIKIFNRNATYLDSCLNKIKIKGIDTFSIKIFVEEIIE